MLRGAMIGISDHYFAVARVNVKGRWVRVKVRVMEVVLVKWLEDEKSEFIMLFNLSCDMLVVLQDFLISLGKYIF